MKSLTVLLVIAFGIIAVACGQAPSAPVLTPTSTAVSPAPPPAAVQPSPAVPPENGPSNGPGLSPEAMRGRDLATRQGCLGCHATEDLVLVGPSWKGLFGKTEQFEDGSAATVDEAYLIQSIREPAAKIVAGFANTMPSTFSNLPQQDVDDIIAFIKELE